MPLIDPALKGKWIKVGDWLRIGGMNKSKYDKSGTLTITMNDGKVKVYKGPGGDKIKAKLDKEGVKDG